MVGIGVGIGATAGRFNPQHPRVTAFPVTPRFGQDNKPQAPAPLQPAPEPAITPDQRAVVAGSYDPVTLGHKHLIQQAARFFKEVIVGLALNPEKSPMFSDQEKQEMLADTIKEFPNVKVKVLRNELLVDFAQNHQANVLVRGIRDTRDFEYEKGMARNNTQAAPQIQTVIFIPPPELENVSSSFVRGMIKTIGWRKWIKPIVSEMVFDKLKSSNLNQRWTKLSSTLGIDSQDAKIMFDTLQKNYSDPTRAYHNKDHLIDCFEMLDQYMNDESTVKPKSREILELSLFFHDIIDERNNPTGVDESAALALAFLAKSKNPKYTHPDQIALLNKNIMATKYSLPPAADMSLDTQLMVDIDLSILGQNADRYQEYTESIRKEYPAVSEAQYKSRRKGVMGRFETLARQNQLYRLPWFQQKLAPNALKNLTAEMTSLSQND